MKIISRKEFLKLPAGVLYSEYEPCVFGDLQIKGDSVGDFDFFTQQIADSVRCNDSGELIDILMDAGKNGTSFQMDFDIESRDGMFNEGQLFAIWEQEDVSALVERLSRIIVSK